MDPASKLLLLQGAPWCLDLLVTQRHQQEKRQSWRRRLRAPRSHRDRQPWSGGHAAIKPSVSLRRSGARHVVLLVSILVCHSCVPDWPFTSVTGRHVHRHRNQYPIRWAADVDGTGSDLLFSPGPCMNAKPSQSYSASTRSAWRLPFFRSTQPDRICSATRHRSGRFRFKCHCSPLTCVLRRPSYADKRRRCPWRTAMGWLC